jgi:hypothetical protein
MEIYTAEQIEKMNKDIPMHTSRKYTPNDNIRQRLEKLANPVHISKLELKRIIRELKSGS